jgi:methylmalonyl-CoA mutase cobalamin-binding subunit
MFTAAMPAERVHYCLSSFCPRSGPNCTDLYHPCQPTFSVYHAQTMYNIKQAAARAGVTVPVLRAWERRYGIVEPARTASGYRLFDDATVARIQTMRTLVEEGWSPSAAAAAILDGTVPVAALAAGVAAEKPAGPDDPAGRADDGATEAAAIAARFVEAARRLQPDAVGGVLDDVFARGSFERVVTDLLFPALDRLGIAWTAGEVSIAGEHMASSVVLHRLGQALEAAGEAERRDRRIIVGMPPGGRHEFGALAFAIAARRAGLAVTYLGADLPADEWVSAAREAAAVVIGVVVPRDRIPALEVAGRLRASHPDLLIAFGGRSAPASTDAMQLPARLTDAVAAIGRAIGVVPSGSGTGGSDRRD